MIARVSFLRAIRSSACALSVLGFLGCLSREPAGPAGSDPSGQAADAADPAHEARVREYILSLGFPEGRIVPAGDHFVVGGCIGFRKDMPLPDAPPAPLAKRSQYLSNYFVNRHIARYIRVRLDGNALGESANLDEALRVLNNTYSDLYFARVTTSNQHILVIADTPTDPNATWTAMGLWPVGGNPGNKVLLNTKQDYFKLGNTLRSQVLIHELLHTVGTDHSVEYSKADGHAYEPFPPSMLVPNTPNWANVDPFGIMQPSFTPLMISIGTTNAISYFDHVAVQYRYPNLRSQRGGDVDGDGKDDLILVTTAGAVSYKLSTGTGLQLGNVPCGTFGDNAGQYLVGDINGDNKADLLFAKDGTVSMRSSTGSGFSAAKTIATSFGSTGAGGFYRILDFNGDGKDDILFVDAAAKTVRIRRANSGGTALESAVYSRAFGDPAGQYFVGDFNGDNKDDILCANRPTQTASNPQVVGPHTVDLLLSTGSDFQSPTQVVCGDCFGHISWDGLYFAADYNGDNKDDIFFKEYDGKFHIHLSTGTGIGTYIGPSANVGDMGTVFHIADFNGDGKADVFATTPYGAAGAGRFLKSNGTSVGTIINLFNSGFGNVASGDLYL